MESNSYAEALYSAVGTRFLFSALARALLRGPDPAAALGAAHLLGMQPDGLQRDRACFFVADGNGRLPLSGWLARERKTLAGCARLSPRILRIRREETSPFEFSMKEFQERALPLYSGCLHSWPQHDAVKEAFPFWPQEKQIDFVHTYLEYFSSGASAEEAPTVEWVRSRRSFRFLFVAEPGPAAPPAVATNPADSAERLADALRLAGLRLFDLCIDRIAQRLKEPPGFEQQYPDKAERVVRTIRVDEERAAKFVPLGAAAEIVWLYQKEECFPSACERRPLKRLSDASFNVGMAEALSRLGEPDARAAEINYAELGLELHRVWETEGRGRAEYEASRSPEFETALDLLRRAAEEYLSQAW